MIHVTVTNQPTNPVFTLMSNVINLCEKFPSAQIGQGKGFGYKIILLRVFLDEIDDNEIILFTDAHDVHISVSHEEIIATYWNFGSEIVFSAEKNCWPVKALETQYLTHGDKYIKYKYLNSGGFIGQAKALRNFIDQNFHNVSGATDDQMFYSQLYLKNQINRKFIQLDTRCEIFQCLHLSLFDIDQATFTNTNTGTKPLVWHSNGALLEFFMKDLCGIPWIPPIQIEIDQQLISPEKNVFCVTETTPSVKFSGITRSVSEVPEGFWIFILGQGVQLPEHFEYRIYGRVLDTRKTYVLVNPDGTLADAHLYFDRSKSTIDEFMRAGMVDAL